MVPDITFSSLAVINEGISLLEGPVLEEYTSAPLHLLPEPRSEFRSALYMKHDVANFSKLSHWGNKRRTLFIMTSWLSRIKQTRSSRRDPVVPFTAQIQYRLIFPLVRLRNIPCFRENLAFVFCLRPTQIYNWCLLFGVKPKADLSSEMAESAFSLSRRAIVCQCCHTLLMLL